MGSDRSKPTLNYAITAVAMSTVAAVAKDAAACTIPIAPLVSDPVGAAVGAAVGDIEDNPRLSPVGAPVGPIEVKSRTATVGELLVERSCAGVGTGVASCRFLWRNVSSSGASSRSARSTPSSFSSGDGLASQVGAVTMLKTTATETAKRRMDMRTIFTLVFPLLYSGKRGFNAVGRDREGEARTGWGSGKGDCRQEVG